MATVAMTAATKYDLRRTRIRIVIPSQDSYQCQAARAFRVGWSVLLTGANIYFSMVCLYHRFHELLDMNFRVVWGRTLK